MSDTFCQSGWPGPLTCTKDHGDLHHARSMDEIQQALKKGRGVFDPDGDPISGARIKSGEDKRRPESMGTFNVGRYGNIGYHVAQILVEDEPFDESKDMAELLKSLATSAKRSS